MAMPRNRADSIVSCFESKTCCKWFDKDYEWDLKLFGDAMYLGCRNIESEADVGVVWGVKSVYISFHGRLNIEVEDGLVLAFALDEEGP